MPRQFIPRLEQLEDRVVPYVTYHGGPLLTNVEIEPYFYGSTWNTNSTLITQRSELFSFNQWLANGPVTDMLSKAGYGVGRGYADYWWNTFAATGTYTDESTIESALQSDITAGNLQSPDSNRLYVVYLQPGTSMTRGGYFYNGLDGYHDSFVGKDHNNNSLRIYFAVMAYPGNGTTYFSGNGNVMDSLTDITTHEVCEAITNPDYESYEANNAKPYGWNDDHFNGQNTAPANAEIGDIHEGDSPNYFYVDGWAVTKIADQNDRAMVPAELTVAGQTINATAGVTFSGQVALGSDPTLLTHGVNLQATIYWGDGTASSGTVSDDGDGHYAVYGSHTWSTVGNYNVEVVLQDQTNSIGYAWETTAQSVSSQYAYGAYYYAYYSYAYAYDALVTGTGSFTTYYYAYYAQYYAYYAYYYSAVGDVADSTNYAYYAYVYSYDAMISAYTDYYYSGGSSVYSYYSYYYAYYATDYSYSTYLGY